MEKLRAGADGLWQKAPTAPIEDESADYVWGAANAAPGLGDDGKAGDGVSLN